MVPDSFKRDTVTLINKKQILSQNDPQNYRPVSGLPFISKLVERVVAAQVANHINANDLGTVYLSAYKQYHSTETALLHIKIIHFLHYQRVCFLL